MDNQGSFIYFNHKIEYRIGNSLTASNTDWRLSWKFKIDGGEWVCARGLIPLRLPDIKRIVRLKLKELGEG